MKKERIYYSLHVSTYNVLDSEKKKDNVAHFTEHKLPKNPHQKVTDQNLNFIYLRPIWENCRASISKSQDKSALQ